MTKISQNISDSISDLRFSEISKDRASHDKCSQNFKMHSFYLPFLPKKSRVREHKKNLNKYNLCLKYFSWLVFEIKKY